MSKAVVVEVRTSKASDGSGIGEGLAALEEDKLARVVAIPEPASPFPLEDEEELALVVVRGDDHAVRECRSVFPTTPLLTVVEHPDGAPGAIENGADHVLTRGASPPIVRAVFLSARREARSRLERAALDAAIQCISDSVEISDGRSRLLFVNDAFERMTGYAPTEVLGKTPAQVVRSGVHDARFYDDIWTTISSKRDWCGSLVGRTKDGTFLTQLAWIKPVLDDRSRVQRVIALKQFIPMSQTLAESGPETIEQVYTTIGALKNSEQHYRKMVAVSNDAILVCDYDTARILEVNDAAVAMFGYEPEEFRQFTPRQLAPPDAGDTITRVGQQLITTGRAVEHRHPMRRRDGRTFYATVQLARYEILGRRQYMAVIRDITESVSREQALERSHQQLAETQTQLLHSSRLAALGQMAAGVAHEINNPLQYVLSGIEELSERPDLDDDEKRVLRDMLDGAGRIRSVTRSLLPFARADGAQLEPVDVNEVVEWATRVTANEIRHRAELVLQLAPIPTIVAQRVRLGQLVTNLLTNAAHAITEGNSERHRITVTTRAVGRRVRLSVEDTGCGIPEEIRSRIFDPFFTTKPRELGTGLGLALCAEIVTRQGGTIEFESIVDRGTRFIVLFGEGTGEARTPPPRSEVPRTERKPRVLLIDDEELLVRTYKRFLKEYEVIGAVGGKAALEILATDHDFDVILCDLMMPSVDGPMVFARVGEIAPQLVPRILFCSGGAFTSRVRSFLEQVPNRVLDKPVTANQLRDAIQKIAAPR